VGQGGVSGTGLHWGKAADPETSQELKSPFELAKQCCGGEWRCLFTKISVGAWERGSTSRYWYRSDGNKIIFQL